MVQYSLRVDGPIVRLNLLTREEVNSYKCNLSVMLLNTVESGFWVRRILTSESVADVVH